LFPGGDGGGCAFIAISRHLFASSALIAAAGDDAQTMTSDIERIVAVIAPMAISN
jgi:hypothetical protein